MDECQRARKHHQRVGPLFRYALQCGLDLGRRFDFMHTNAQLQRTGQGVHLSQVLHAGRIAGLVQHGEARHMGIDLAQQFHMLWQ
jgi:hypothetical protein